MVMTMVQQWVSGGPAAREPRKAKIWWSQKLFGLVFVPNFCFVEVIHELTRKIHPLRLPLAFLFVSGILLCYYVHRESDIAWEIFNIHEYNINQADNWLLIGLISTRSADLIYRHWFAVHWNIIIQLVRSSHQPCQRQPGTGLNYSFLSRHRTIGSNWKFALESILCCTMGISESPSALATLWQLFIVVAPWLMGNEWWLVTLKILRFAGGLLASFWNSMVRGHAWVTFDPVTQGHSPRIIG